MLSKLTILPYRVLYVRNGRILNKRSVVFLYTSGARIWVVIFKKSYLKRKFFYFYVKKSGCGLPIEALAVSLRGLKIKILIFEIKFFRKRAAVLALDSDWVCTITTLCTTRSLNLPQFYSSIKFGGKQSIIFLPRD